MLIGCFRGAPLAEGGPARPSNGVEAMDAHSGDLRKTDSGVPGLIEWFHLPWNRRLARLYYNSTKTTRSEWAP